MKKASIIIIILGALLAVAHLQFDLFTPAPVKAYREYRQTMASETKDDTYSEAYWLQEWKVKIEQCKTTGDSAEIYAEHVYYWMPLNAASYSFATIVTENLYAELQKESGTWNANSNQPC